MQNLDLNWVSESETIDSESSSRLQISITNLMASSIICSSAFRRMKCTILENLSTMTYIFVYSSDVGNPTMKSMHIAVHGLLRASIGSSSHTCYA